MKNYTSWCQPMKRVLSIALRLDMWITKGANIAGFVKVADAMIDQASYKKEIPIINPTVTWMVGFLCLK